MAEEEKPPAFIDYDSSTDIETEHWNSSNFETYWRQCLVKKRKVAAVPWSIKVKSLAKKMIQEFDLFELKDMINYWAEYGGIEHAPSFEHFYMQRYKIHDKVKPKDYSEWD